MGATKDKIKRIYEMLPQLNCGLCGFEGCGQFAKAVAEGSASPFGCKQDPGTGYRISEIMGIKAPIFDYYRNVSRPGFTPRPGAAVSLGSLGAEVKELSGISIIGNKEAPKSLYIVPWHNSEVGVATSLNSGLLDDSMRPLDKEVFLRELDFYELSHGIK